MKKAIFIFLVLITFFGANAQTFYETHFKDPNDHKRYTGLMIYYNDENCHLRLANNKMVRKGLVYEAQYRNISMSKENADDVGIMAYISDDEAFPAFVWMWEADDASDISQAPFVTYDLEDENAYFEAEYFEEIQLKDMDEEYISQFFGEDEKEYQMMLNGINVAKQTNTAIAKSAPTPSAPNTPVFHLLIVANTQVSDIGTACRRDLSNIKGEFNAIAKVLGMKIDEHIISDDSYNKENVSNMIQNLKAADNDVILFAYTGHGFRFDNQTDKYPNIDLSASNYDDITKNYLALSDIYNAISSKGARLNLILSDCCNTPIGREAPMINANTLYSRANSNFDINRLRTLFLESKGNVLATAASPGEASWCSQSGGFFLLSMIESLRSQISPLETAAPSWERLIQQAVNSAHSKSVSNASCKAQNGLSMVESK